MPEDKRPQVGGVHNIDFFDCYAEGSIGTGGAIRNLTTSGHPDIEQHGNTAVSSATIHTLYSEGETPDVGASNGVKVQA